MIPPPKPDLRSLFDKVLDLGPIDRAKFLQNLQLTEPLLYRDLRDILLAHEGPSAFFEQDGGVWAQLAPADFTGRRFGAYSIVKMIGRGGMGVVYQATRADDAFSKTVAIKLISVMVLSESFRRERQILAQLEHPNIARLLDGGATDDGLLYLVMEYVDGQPLDEYIESRRLNVEEILRLFLQVTSAVSYAHQNLIVHRDLKPSNILVTKQGEVKLLDFGIAKVLNPNRNETATVALRLTPEFASPEQIRGDSISTVSDVYSLGVLLFHTLTGGVRPYRTTSQTVTDILQSVLDSVTPRPSSVAPPRFAKKLKGDLDNIILKAMAKEPERRYASVNQLQEDLERHLSARPVLAQGDHWSYRAGKFIRRHQLAAVASLVLILSIAAGVISTLREKKEAEERYQSVRSLATSILVDINESLKDVPGAIPARKKAVLAAVKQLESLAQKSADDPALIEDLAAAYEQTAEIMASMFEDPKDGALMAAPAFAKAIELRYKLPSSLKTADVERRIGNNQINAGDFPKAIQNYERSIATAEKQPRNQARETTIGLAHSNLCTAKLLLNAPADAAGHCWAAVRLLTGDEAVPANLTFAKVHLLLQKPNEALTHLQSAVEGINLLDPKSLLITDEVLALLNKIPGTSRLQAAAEWKRGTILSRKGERDQSLESFERALKLVGNGITMRKVIAFAEACTLYSQALEELKNGQVQRAIEDKRKVLTLLSESTSGAASLLRAELDSTLAKPPQ